jgi:hypothetical protein
LGSIHGFSPSYWLSAEDIHPDTSKDRLLC